MNSEQIVQQSVKSIILLIESFDSDQAKQVAEKMTREWPLIWSQIKSLLESQESMNGRDETLDIFARQLVPDYGKFEYTFRQSLSIHSEFWNQVYYNLSLAKQRLPIH